MPEMDFDAELSQPRHVVVLGCVGSLHAIAERVHHLGDAAHSDAADAYKVEVLVC